MSTQLIHIAGNRIYNKTLFRPHLYIYDNRVVYKKRSWISKDELVITYNHIAQINIHKFIVRFAHIEIITTAQQVIKVRWVKKGQAIKVKRLVEQKIHQAHRKHSKHPEHTNLEINDFELSLKRLKELLTTGKITDREFKKKKKHLLKKHY